MGPEWFASLCADGTLAYASKQGAKFTVRHTAQFFDAENDPVFEESLVDRYTGRAFFISYTGMVYPAQLGDEVRLDAPWSLQEAAGMPRATTQPELLAWRPGGGRFATYHKASGRLFVLMHAGEHWTHKKGGNEIWVFDVQAHKRIARFALEKPATLLTVTQDAQPLLFVVAVDSRAPVDFRCWIRRPARCCAGSAASPVRWPRCRVTDERRDRSGRDGVAGRHRCAALHRAGIGKLTRWHEFKGTLDAYRLLPSSSGAARGLGDRRWPKSSRGLALVSRLASGRFALVAAPMFACFGVAMAINLARGRRFIDCGCFRGVRQPLEWRLVCATSVLALAAFASSNYAMPTVIRNAGYRPCRPRASLVVLYFALNAVWALDASRAAAFKRS